MTTPDIVLHQWSISPYCGKVRKVLDLKGLRYRLEDYGGLRALKPKSLSASGKLPVLDYDGTRLEDSSAIARWLDARHPSPPLWPAAEGDRQLAYLLEDWADESLYWFELWLRVFDPEALDRTVAIACQGRARYEWPIFKQGMRRYRSRVIAQGLGRYPSETVLANFRAHLSALDGRLAQGSWLVGDAPSIADIAVAAQLDEVMRTSSLASAIEALPRLASWLRRCQFPAASAAP
jgi:glutathione S-transferase